MKKLLLLTLLISGMLLVSGCSDLFGPHIHFKNTSGAASESITIYDDTNNPYITEGILAIGALTAPEPISPGDYSLVLLINGTKYVFNSDVKIEDGKDYVCTYYLSSIAGTYGCKIEEY